MGNWGTIKYLYKVTNLVMGRASIQIWQPDPQVHVTNLQKNMESQ